MLVKKFEYMRGYEETQLGLVTATDQRDIPDLMTSYPVYKVWGQREEGENAWSYGVSLPKSLLHVMGPCFPGDETVGKQ